VLALSVGSTPAFAQPAAGEKLKAAKPAEASKPREVTKISTQIGPEGKRETISILIDVNDAPDVKDWAMTAANHALKWYPRIEEALAEKGTKPGEPAAAKAEPARAERADKTAKSEDAEKPDNAARPEGAAAAADGRGNRRRREWSDKTPREVTLRFTEMKGVAHASGATITIAADWVRQHPEDLGMVVHELTHVIQHYPPRGQPGWLTEGIADYVRYYVAEPESRQKGFDRNRANFDSGYQASAAFLNFVETTKGPGVVAKLNTALRAGTYKPETFKELAGAEPADLWTEFKGTWGKK
jgi:hypothetical protein